MSIIDDFEDQMKHLQDVIYQHASTIADLLKQSAERQKQVLNLLDKKQHFLAKHEVHALNKSHFPRLPDEDIKPLTHSLYLQAWQAMTVLLHSTNHPALAANLIEKELSRFNLYDLVQDTHLPKTDPNGAYLTYHQVFSQSPFPQALKQMDDLPSKEKQDFQPDPFGVPRLHFNGPKDILNNLAIVCSPAMTLDQLKKRFDHFYEDITRFVSQSDMQMEQSIEEATRIRQQRTEQDLHIEPLQAKHIHGQRGRDSTVVTERTAMMQSKQA